ncbi:hypothetical protein [Microcoleus sp. MON2_D5]|uniref:hypothetical protein n=1 Tax=Microcoleus sp. MON2_D5 TaxID=2818833 RepID=UPI002FD219AF
MTYSCSQRLETLCRLLEAEPSRSMPRRNTGTSTIAPRCRLDSAYQVFAYESLGNVKPNMTRWGDRTAG